MFICFPGISFTQWHPFSISSSPNESDGEYSPKEFSIFVKAIGGFTTSICQAAASDPTKIAGRNALVEGPYGSVMIDHFAYRTLLCVAGGVGVTPFISLINELSNEPAGSQARTIHLHWAVRDLSLAHALLPGMSWPLSPLCVSSY